MRFLRALIRRDQVSRSSSTRGPCTDATSQPLRPDVSAYVAQQLISDLPSMRAHSMLAYVPFISPFDSRLTRMPRQFDQDPPLCQAPYRQRWIGREAPAPADEQPSASQGRPSASSPRGLYRQVHRRLLQADDQRDVSPMPHCFGLFIDPCRPQSLDGQAEHGMARLGRFGRVLRRPARVVLRHHLGHYVVRGDRGHQESGHPAVLVGGVHEEPLAGEDGRLPRGRCHHQWVYSSSLTPSELSLMSCTPNRHQVHLPDLRGCSLRVRSPCTRDAPRRQGQPSQAASSG
jgi:hypothetical protein